VPNASSGGTETAVVAKSTGAELGGVDVVTPARGALVLADVGGPAVVVVVVVEVVLDPHAATNSATKTNATMAGTLRMSADPTARGGCQAV